MAGPKFRRVPILRRKRVEPETQPRAVSLSDPAIAALLGGGTFNWSEEPVSEATAKSLSAVWRAGLVIGGAIGGLPLKTYTTKPDETRERVKSFFDDPAAVVDGSPTLIEWKQKNVAHLFFHGEAPLLHRYTEGGALVGLEPVHPMALGIRRATATEKATKSYPDGLVYTVREYTEDGVSTRQVDLGSNKITVIRGPVMCGLRGTSFLSHGRNSLGISLAGEKAAGKMFANGAMINGVLVPAAGEDVSLEDAEAIKADLDQQLFGTDNAGKVPLVNRILQFLPWQMTNLDAQFLESRQFQIEEVARWTGVPPHKLMALEKTTSWGTGISEQNKALAQDVLMDYTTRMEERFSRLLPNPRFTEFDYAGLLAGSAKDVSALLLTEVNGGIRTPNEGRRVLNLPPIEGGDTLRVPSGVMLQPQLDAAAAIAEAQIPTEPETTP